jgi:RNA polymerase subunit RPABC4/transcription elongation factor Spt4
MEAAPQRMDQIFQTIQDTIGGFFKNPVVQLSIQALVVYFVILWLAAAYWAFRDMQQRSENPVLPYLAAALIVLFTPLLFVFGIIVYRIIRPHEKIGEVYERNLAEEALLAEVEAIKSCPTCARRVNEEWIICPTCRTRLNRVCPNCSRLVGLDWSLCAWCGKDFERPASALAASTGGRPAPITPLPAADDPTRLGRAADPTFADPERKTGTDRTTGRSRASAPRAAAPDVLPEG